MELYVGDLSPSLHIQTEPKDYVTTNAVSVILADPKPGLTEPVDYLQKPDFGKIPKYISRIKSDLKKQVELEMKLRQEAEMASRSKQRILTDDERKELAAGLSSKWKQVNSEYQKITHMTVLDTIGKVRRKELLEEQLEQLETDMKLINRNEDIYIDLEN
jgi:hypothetical protein